MRIGEADHPLVPYSTRQYGPNHRWLMKALREVGGELESLLASFPSDDIERRSAPERWSAREVALFLRESEREDLRAVEAMIARDGITIAERRAHLVPGEPRARQEPLHDLVWDFIAMREEMLWLLQLAAGGWDHVGRHPYRGEVSLSQYVHEINERDLEAMWQLRQLQEAFAAAVQAR